VCRLVRLGIRLRDLIRIMRIRDKAQPLRVMVCITWQKKKEIMKALIVYYSFTHNNEMLADELRSLISADVCKIEEVKKRTGFTILLDLLLRRTPKLKEFHLTQGLYDHCIFIAPIWAGQVASPMKSFLLQEKRNIGMYSFLTLCGGVQGQNQKISRQLSTLVGHDALHVIELTLTDLASEKEIPKLNSAYRLQPNDLLFFKDKLNQFVKKLTPAR
jgi:flavodoxin